MGNHRAERHGLRRAPSGERATRRERSAYVGKRVAGRSDVAAAHASTPTIAPSAASVASPREVPVLAELDTPTVETPAAVIAAYRPPVPVVSTGTHYFNDFDVTSELPLVPAPSPAGRRKAVKHAGSRGPLVRGLPSPPLLAGVAALAISIGGALTAGSPSLAGHETGLVARPASALSGADGVGSVNGDHGRTPSRDSSRDTLAAANGGDLQPAAEAQVEERNAKLGKLAAKAQQTADDIAKNRWISPLEPIVLTARFGDYGLWSHAHTGLDFNGDNGDPIHSIAYGTVTFVGYDGSYGKKTVVTLPDGTEIWYCHQTTQYVSEGDTVVQDEVIGTVGSTGHVTGSHLHVEVRPGGGDPVDPYPAFVHHGVALPP